jgi:hypothetical protein
VDEVAHARHGLQPTKVFSKVIKANNSQGVYVSLRTGKDWRLSKLTLGNNFTPEEILHTPQESAIKGLATILVHSQVHTEIENGDVFAQPQVAGVCPVGFSNLSASKIAKEHSRGQSDSPFLAVGYSRYVIPSGFCSRTYCTSFHRTKGHQV